MFGMPDDIWVPIKLTIELATISTLALLVVATPLAWWLARSKAWFKEAAAAIVSLPMVLPPTVLGFYLLIALGPDGPGGLIASLWGARTLAFTFTGLVIGSILSSMPFVVQPIRNAFAAVGDRPLEVASTLRASPTSRLLDRRAAAREPRPAHRRGARLRPHGRRVRRDPDDRRQHPRPHAGHVDRDLRLCRDDALARGQPARRRHGGVRLRGHPGDDAPREALHASGRVTASHAIRAQFRGTIGKFALDAGFTAPAKGVTALFGPSGCGKTTVLRCIAGLLRINGVCEIDGEVWQDENGAFLPTHKRPLGYVFQEASLFQHLSVRNNLLFGAPRDNRDGTKAAASSLTKWSSCSASRGCSTAARAISRAASGSASRSGGRFCRSRSFCLMDEPLSALDRATKNEILPFLERLRDHLNLPVVYITHDIAEVERLADQMVLMDKGHVIGAGPLEVLQSDPSLPLAAARDAAVGFVGIVQASDETYGLLTLQVRGGLLTVPAPAAPVGERRRIRVIASDVSLTREAPAPSSILNVLPARVVSTKPVDASEIIVVVALGHDGAGARLLVARDAKGVGGARPRGRGQVYAQVKAVALAPGRGEVG